MCSVISSFFLEDIKYKVIDSSNCMWATSKGAKGNHVFNLVRQMFDKNLSSDGV